MPDSMLHQYASLGSMTALPVVPQQLLTMKCSLCLDSSMNVQVWGIVS